MVDRKLVSRSVSPAARLEAQSVEDGTGCRVWTGGIKKHSGFGVCKVDGKEVSPHALAFKLSKGVDHIDGTLKHTCGNKLCVNPEHIVELRKGELDQAALKKLLSYDAATGVFVWLVGGGKTKVGAIAGSFSDGYVSVYVLGKPYKAHRLAWLYSTGSWPASDVDHINGDRSDNRIDNLRLVSKAQNRQNVRRAADGNSTNLLGVSKDSNSSSFRSRIQVDGKSVYLGSFKSAEEAHNAYVLAKRKYHSHGTL
jgi:hypothetical protein